VIDWAENVIDTIGLVGVAFLIALESIIPPIPSEMVLLLSGFNVQQGRFPLVPAILLATVGSVVGAWGLYWLGAAIRGERLELYLSKVGRWMGLTRDDVATGFSWFNRHGPKVVFFGRLIPVVRSVVSIPAGAERMSFLSFTTLTAAGSLLWNTLWIVIGRQLGEQWHRAEEWQGVVEKVVIAVLVVAAVWLVVKARRRSRSRAPLVIDLDHDGVDDHAGERAVDPLDDAADEPTA
jgi:membrane protein DedA with SNARE-associated domain